MDTKEYMREYYRKNKDVLDSRSKEWALKNADRLREYRRKYYQEHRKEILDRNSKWREENIEKRPSHTAVYRAVKGGDLIRPNHCEACGKECYPDGHHDNYDDKLSVVWLCRKCHKNLK